MLVYRVFFYDRSAAEGTSGHPYYLHRPQAHGRWDNPDLYDSWYFAKSAEGAVGEVFGNLARWTPAMFDTRTPGLRRALAVCSVPDELSTFNFDDARNLVTINMRPSEVVIRNKAFTQKRASSLWAETGSDGLPRWSGLEWWSFHFPQWTNLMMWVDPLEPSPATLREVIPLNLSTPAVIEAASVLRRPL
ncbi:RES domain-containing protein [Brevibacterium sp.]|uniref:RES domain-containing protein n=1 Tax=Brevibacterium sp. TaxID=1701 RepID=UPI0035C82033